MKNESVARLAVHARRVHSGSAPSSLQIGVFCQSRQRSVPIDECKRCGYCDGIEIDPASGDTFLVCRRHGSAETEVPGTGATPAGRTPVSAAMTRVVVCVEPSLSLEALVVLLLERGIGGAPVVDAHGRTVGMVSKTDLLRERNAATAETATVQSGEREIELGPGFHVEQIMSGTVADVMTPVAFTITEETTIARAAALMAYEGIHRLPVVDANRQVVGILTTLDVMRWIARGDGFVVPDRRRAGKP